MGKSNYVLFRATINYYLTCAGLTKRKLAVRMHIGEPRLYKKLRTPESFTVGELKAIKNILQIPDDAIGFIWN